MGWILGYNCRKGIEIFNGSLHGLDLGSTVERGLQYLRDLFVVWVLGQQ